MSVEAFQLRLICEEDAAEAVSPAGVDGAVVSAVLLTVTVTPALVVAFPAASLAIARTVCDPLLAVEVFQEYAYGEVVSRLPALAPSSWNCTLATPTLSEAVAVTLTVPDTVAPLAGAVIDTVGAVVSVVLLTVTVTLALVVELPAPSFAMARKVCEPLLAEALFHEKTYGAAVSRLPTLALSN